MYQSKSKEILPGHKCLLGPRVHQPLGGGIVRTRVQSNYTVYVPLIGPKKKTSKTIQNNIYQLIISLKYKIRPVLLLVPKFLLILSHGGFMIVWRIHLDCKSSIISYITVEDFIQTEYTVERWLFSENIVEMQKWFILVR